jgi:hypothetical protein
MGVVVVGVSVGVDFSGMDEEYDIKNVDQVNPTIKPSSCPFGVEQFCSQRHQTDVLENSEVSEVLTSVALASGNPRIIKI